MIAKVDSALQNKDLILCPRSYFTSNVNRDQAGHIGSLLVASSALKVLLFKLFFHLCELLVTMFLYYYISTIQPLS